MKKINFEELMASVSEQFVEEAASFSPIKVFNTRFVALAACIAIIVTAIPAVVILNREKDVDAPKVTTPVEDIVVTPGGEEEENKSLNVIYCDSLMMKKEGLIQNAFNDKKVEIKDIDGFFCYNRNYTLNGTKLDPDINTPAELNFILGELNFVAKLESVYYTSRSDQITDNTLKENNKIAKYLIETINGETTEKAKGHGEIYYSVASQEIVCMNTRTLPQYSNEKITEEAFWEIVKKDVTNLYGEDFLSKYSVKITFYYNNPTPLNKGGWQYRVQFDRNFNGFSEFEVDEYVVLEYTGSGQLYKIRSRNLNAFNSVESLLTQEVANQVEEKAMKLLEGRLVGHKKLEMSIDGNVYAFYRYLLREDEMVDFKTSGNFRIKVNID